METHFQTLKTCVQKFFLPSSAAGIEANWSPEFSDLVHDSAVIRSVFQEDIFQKNFREKRKEIFFI